MFLLKGKWLGILGSLILLSGLVIKWLVFLKDYTTGLGNIVVWTIISIGAFLFVTGALCVLSIHWWTNRLMQETLENVDDPEKFIRKCKEERMNRGSKSPGVRSLSPLQSPPNSPSYSGYQSQTGNSSYLTEQLEYRQATVCRADSKLSTVSNHLPVIGELESNRNSVNDVLGVLHNGAEINQIGLSGSLTEIAIDHYFTSVTNPSSSSTVAKLTSHHVRQSSTASMNICTAIPATLCASAKIVSANASSSNTAFHREELKTS